MIKEEIKESRYKIIDLFDKFVKIICNHCGEVIGIFEKTDHSLYEYHNKFDYGLVVVDENGVVYEFYAEEEEFLTLSN